MEKLSLKHNLMQAVMLMDAAKLHVEEAAKQAMDEGACAVEEATDWARRDLEHATERLTTEVRVLLREEQGL